MMIRSNTKTFGFGYGEESKAMIINTEEISSAVGGYDRGNFVTLKMKNGDTITISGSIDEFWQKLEATTGKGG